MYKVDITKRYGKLDRGMKKAGKRGWANRLESQQSYRTMVKRSLPMGRGMKELSWKEVE